MTEWRQSDVAEICSGRRMSDIQMQRIAVDKYIEYTLYFQT